MECVSVESDVCCSLFLSCGEGGYASEFIYLIIHRLKQGNNNNSRKEKIKKNKEKGCVFTLFWFYGFVSLVRLSA